MEESLSYQHKCPSSRSKSSGLGKGYTQGLHDSIGVLLEYLHFYVYIYYSKKKSFQSMFVPLTKDQVTCKI
jgi:hypothetical protein